MPVIEDGLVCIVDACDEDDDFVIHFFDHMVCADSNFCMFDVCDM